MLFSLENIISLIISFLWFYRISNPPTNKHKIVDNLQFLNFLREVRNIYISKYNQFLGFFDFVNFVYDGVIERL